MSALAEVAAVGGRIWVEGDKLKYTLPEDRKDLLEALRNEKPRLLPLLRAIYQACAGLELDPIRLALGLDADDMEALGREPPETLRAYAEAVAERLQRERGEVPAHYTAVTTCNGCGPVPIFEGAPAHIAGCPWCWNRAKGLPIPTIKTENSDHE